MWMCPSWEKSPQIPPVTGENPTRVWSEQQQLVFLLQTYQHLPRPEDDYICQVSQASRKCFLETMNTTNPPALATGAKCCVIFVIETFFNYCHYSIYLIAIFDIDYCSSVIFFFCTKKLSKHPDSKIINYNSLLQNPKTPKPLLSFPSDDTSFLLSAPAHLE